MAKAASIGDYRMMAHRRLPRFLFEYIDGGSYLETTLARNVADLQAIALRQRVLRDVSTIELSTELFGRKVSLPLALGPVGLAGLYARRGEVQTACAAAAAGVPFCLSTLSVCPVWEVAAGSPAPFWFQLYMLRDRGFMRELLARAKEAACPVLVFTVDLPTPGTRYRDYRSGLSGAPGLRGTLRRFAQALGRAGWSWDVGLRGRPHILGNVAPVLGAQSGLEDFLTWIRDNFDPRVTWADLDWIRENWRGPLVIKGILDPEDARAALRVGADGLVVSNHGGRQLDGVMSSAAALPAIAEVVGGRMTVFADGGVRTGLDILRMLALGADAVMIGRAWAYALAGRGQAGVAHILDLFATELRVAMALTGITSLGGATRDVIVPAARVDPLAGPR